jgi:hypothetical protein
MLLDVELFRSNFGDFRREINDAFPHKRHQKRRLESCTAHLLGRRSRPFLWLGTRAKCDSQVPVKCPEYPVLRGFCS